MLIVNWELKIIFLSRVLGGSILMSHCIGQSVRTAGFMKISSLFFFFLNTVALKSLTDTSFESLPSFPALLFNSVGAGSGFTLFSS